jgi:hydroxylamine dehydrogenase
MKSRQGIILAGLLFFGLIWIPLAGEESPPLSEESRECINCHAAVTPGIVEDWRGGQHAHGTPASSMAKGRLSRVVSAESVPEHLKDVVVGCFECHGLNTDRHEDGFDHFGYAVHVIPSPRDCGVCHAEEEQQFASSKKAYAVANLMDNPLYHKLVETATSVKSIEGWDINQGESSANAKNESCLACHGTRIGVEGVRTIENDLAGELDVPVLTNWPNQGVGRINPDGSRGACTACHPRHGFSIAVARQPDTCSQCHLEPDLPAWDVYRESKHGNIFHSLRDDYDWESIPWTLGKDFRSPTCAVCHNSLIVDPEGEVVAERSHDFGARLWVRIFGLIYSHPQPRSGDTTIIRNSEGQTLPTSFMGKPASEYLLDEGRMEERRRIMTGICTACHGSSWAVGFFKKMDATLKEADAMVLAATRLMGRAWDEGLADSSNPFDESLEQKWVSQWLIYANGLRYASAMSGPDFAAFKSGWWKLTRTLQDMKETISVKRLLKKMNML